VLAAIEQRRGLRALDVVRSTRYLMFITGPPLLRTTMNPGERMRPGGGGHDPVLSGYTANRSPDGAQPREGRADLTRKPGAQCAISAMSLSEAISHRSKHHRATRVWPKPAASPIDVGSERVGRRAAVFVFRVLIARRA